jgi:serine/threonine protein kinase
MPSPDFGEYEILQLIGAGARSRVYKVCDRHTRKRFAVKHVLVDSPEAERCLRQLQNEFERARDLRHPNIVRVYDLVARKRLLRVTEAYLVMELVRGKPMVRHAKTYTFEQLIFYFRQVADALAYVHEHGLIHTDIKPKNLMITSKDLVKIVDFGQATTPGRSKGRVQGTFEFMAPEQILDEVLDERTDVFNLAATMYFMLSGRHIPPMVAATLGKVDFVPSRRLRPGSIAELNPNVTPKLDHLLRRSCSRVREDRPPSMRNFIGEFEAAIAEPALGPDPPQ